MTASLITNRGQQVAAYSSVPRYLPVVRDHLPKAGLPAHVRPIPKSGKARFGALEIDFRDWGHAFGIVQQASTRFEIGHHSLGLRWQQNGRSSFLEIAIDGDGYLLGVDGQRIQHDGHAVHVLQHNGASYTRVGFFHTVFGMDGSILRTRRTITDGKKFTDHFFPWARTQTAGFPYAAKLTVDQDGFMRLPAALGDVPVTTEPIMESYGGRVVYMVPLRLDGRVVCMFFSARQEYLEARFYDPVAMAFYYQDPTRYDGKRFYLSAVQADYSLSMLGVDWRVGTARRQVGDVLRVVTDENRNLVSVSSFESRLGLVVHQNGNHSALVGRASEKDRLMADGTGVGTAVAKPYPREVRNGRRQPPAVGIKVSGRVKYFSADDLMEYAIAPGDRVHFRHEDGVVTDLTVHGKGIPFILNRQVDREGRVSLQNSYRSNVPEDQLTGLRILEGLRLARRTQEELSVFYGGNPRLSFPAPPFDVSARPLSVVCLDGARPLFFRDVARFGRTERIIAQKIAERLGNRRIRRPEGDEYARQVMVAKSWEAEGEHNFLSTDNMELAEDAYLEAFRVCPALWEPLEDAMSVRRTIILRRAYLSHRGSIRARVRKVLDMSTIEGLLYLRDALLSEELDAMVTAHMLEILAGVHAGTYPGNREPAARILSAVPLLFNRNDIWLRRNLVGALRILYEHEPTHWIVSAITTQMPDSLKKMRTRLVGYFGFRTEPYRDGLTTLAPSVEWTMTNALREAPAKRDKTQPVPRIRYTQPTTSISTTVSFQLGRLAETVQVRHWDRSKDDIISSMRSVKLDYDHLVECIVAGSIPSDQAWRRLAEIYQTLKVNWGEIGRYAAVRWGGDLPGLKAELRAICDRGVFELQDILLSFGKSNRRTS